MYHKKIEHHLRCPLEYALHIIGGKWKPRIICVLSKYDTLRFSELKDALYDISDTTLAESLKQLQEDDMIVRIAYAEIPPRVEYTLSDKAQSLSPILKRLCDWAADYYVEPEILENPSYSQCLNEKNP